MLHLALAGWGNGWWDWDSSAAICSKSFSTKRILYIGEKTSPNKSATPASTKIGVSKTLQVFRSQGHNSLNGGYSYHPLLQCLVATTLKGKLQPAPLLRCDLHAAILDTRDTGSSGHQGHANDANTKILSNPNERYVGNGVLWQHLPPSESPNKWHKWQNPCQHEYETREGVPEFPPSDKWWQEPFHIPSLQASVWISNT